MSASQVAKANERRQIDARLVEPGNKTLKPRAPLGERQLPQILIAVGEQIVSAQMHRKFGQKFRGHAFSIEALLKNVEALHPSVAHDEKFAVDRTRQPQRFDQIGKAPGNVFAGARIKPSGHSLFKPCCNGLDADAVPLPFGHEFRRIECRKIRLVERVRQHRRPERRRIAACRLVGAAFQPGEQSDIWRRQAGPEQLNILRIACAKRSNRGFGKPRRDANAQSAGDELDQRPAPGLVERVEPARQPRRQFGLAEGGEGLDDDGQRQFFRILPGRAGGSGEPAAAIRLGHISATVSERSPT